MLLHQVESQWSLVHQRYQPQLAKIDIVSNNNDRYITPIIIYLSHALDIWADFFVLEKIWRIANGPAGQFVSV